MDKCILWQGHIDRFGYGRVGRCGAAHRVAYEKAFGAIPPGMEIDHLCRNRACVNPAHLEAVTHRENMLRSTSFSAVNAAKTHCSNGHEFTAENTYVHRNRRACRACNRLAAKAYKQRRAA